MSNVLHDKNEIFPSIFPPSSLQIFQLLSPSVTSAYLGAHDNLRVLRASPSLSMDAQLNKANTFNITEAALKICRTSLPLSRVTAMRVRVVFPGVGGSDGGLGVRRRGCRGGTRHAAGAGCPSEHLPTAATTDSEDGSWEEQDQRKQASSEGASSERGFGKDEPIPRANNIPGCALWASEGCDVDAQRTDAAHELMTGLREETH